MRGDYKTTIELTESEYLFLNSYLDEERNRYLGSDLQRFDGIILSPVDLDDLKVHDSQNLILVKVYYNQPSDLFLLGKAVSNYKK